MQAAPDGAYDTLASAGAPARWQQSWAATEGRARWLLGAAAVLVALAVMFGELAVNSTPRHVTRSVVAQPLHPVVTTDAAGCPASVRCTVSTAATPALNAAIVRAFPSADVVSTMSTLDAATGRVYRRVVVALAGTATVTVASQCIPGAGAVPRQVLQSDRSFQELDGSTVVLSRTWQVVTPGRAGCSASVGADTRTPKHDVNVPSLRLAADPAVQLR